MTIWTGRRQELVSFFEKGKPIELPTRSIETNRVWAYRSESHAEGEGTDVSYSLWQSERTVIEWQGKPLRLDPHERVGSVGIWQVFSETVPNMEVRLGAILSLERIAQDSTNYDGGRDHVRVMEILCAYIRGNSPASSAIDHPDGEWRVLEDGATGAEFREHHTKCEARFRSKPGWFNRIPNQREDIALALYVIGRRSTTQRLIEARWGSEQAVDAPWIFNSPFSDDPFLDREPLDLEGLESLREKIGKWKEDKARNRGYRLNLSNTNLQSAYLSSLNFSGAEMQGVRLEGASLHFSHFEGAAISGGRFEGSKMIGTHFEGASLPGARFEGALVSAGFEGAFLSEASFECASIISSRFEHADLSRSQLNFARLRGRTRLEGAWLRDAQFKGALLEGDFSAAGLSQQQINEAFGSKSTRLPRRRKRPSYWPALDFDDLWDEYLKWCAEHT